MKIFSMTDVGRKREMNQDYVYATDEPLGTLPNLSGSSRWNGWTQGRRFCVKIYGGSSERRTEA